MDDIEVGWIIKWRSYFGERVGKVVEIVSHPNHAASYYVSENRSTQGFPGVPSPTLISHADVIEVVSRDG